MINAEFLVRQIMNNPQMQNNPIMQNAIKMYQQGNEKGLTELCQNVCKTNGTSIEEMRRKYGI